MDNVVKMKPPGFWENSENLYWALADDPWESEDADEEIFENYAVNIEQAKYVKVSGEEVSEQQKHLSEYQRKELARVLNKFPQLFDGNLGHYTGRQVHLDIRPDAVPVHQKPYSVPKSHEEVFKKELEHLCAIGVLYPCGPTEWGAPTFFIHKKDGQVC